jgi:oligoribonuclease NrnB/cAMP/cGMP phosphodiesterase (DHH superfamily)
VSDTYVLYHGKNCMDGMTCAYIASLVHPHATLIPCSYGEPFPDIPAGSEVYLTDFAFDRETMEREHARASYFRCYDHHKSHEAALAGLPYCVFDMNRSGAGILWDEWMAPQERPWWVDYIEARDLWKLQRYPDVQEVSAYIASFPCNLSSWRMWIDAGLGEAKSGGQHIARYKARLIEEHLKRAGYETIAGIVVPVVNVSPYNLLSETAGELAKGHVFAAAYFVEGDGTKQFSLRSVSGGQDVSHIAKQYGGGGHHNAAGFRLAPGAKL